MPAIVKNIVVVYPKSGLVVAYSLHFKQVNELPFGNDLGSDGTFAGGGCDREKGLRHLGMFEGRRLQIELISTSNQERNAQPM
eukprot:5412280-Amphidinium_carterae.1